MTALQEATDEQAGANRSIGSGQGATPNGAKQWTSMKLTRQTTLSLHWHSNRDLAHFDLLYRNDQVHFPNPF
jgi:hypothetical protein